MSYIDQEKIGKFIADIRNKKGLKQEELGSLIGASSKTISKWERGLTFPDVSFQMPLCKTLGITLEELHNGKYNLKERRKAKYWKLYKKISISFILLSIPILIFFVTYFFTHNQYKIYEMVNQEQNENKLSINGLLVEKYKFNVLYIAQIEILDYDYTIKDEIDVKVYINDKIVFHQDSFQPIIIKHNKENFNDNKISIKIVEANGKIHYYETKMEFLLLNRNTITFDQYKSNIDNYKKVANTLKKIGFKKNDDVWKKVVDNKEGHKELKFYVSNGMFTYENNYHNIDIYIKYYAGENYMEVNIFNDQGNYHLLVERYTYNYNSKNIVCDVGSCYSLEEMLKIMGKYVNLLNGE